MSRIFVIGDIHGCYDELMTLTQKVNLQEEDWLISVGDILDRGGKSKEVYEYFRNRPNSKVLIGNHERKHINNVLSYAQEIVKLQFGEVYTELLAWLSKQDYYFETPETIIVHAAFEHDQPLQQQREDVLSGSTSGEKYLEKKYTETPRWKDHYRGEKTIIYGHHVVGDTPEKHGNTIGIDTAACHGGYLTAIELPGFHIHQVKAARDYWKEEQVNWQVPVLKAKDWENMTFDMVRKQLNKLAYIEVPEVRAFLSGVEKEMMELQGMYTKIIEGIVAFVERLGEERFLEEANKYSFKAFLFKSRANNLKVEDLEKSLNTMGKVKALVREIME
ncbi:metallophosphoesterase [Chitinophaga tropicalis]|uniref:Metallophosphoesterase n=1 Tax=Chitinophaga tropicalis TaxID=2683588 RepID=A0A7K1UDB7_9BACT|nr:metallophosphoesterase [Chitinophaga tropicalis]MVT12369.1 metallophosphoesterase [Chitinophaga tropicalis]